MRTDWKVAVLLLSGSMLILLPAVCTAPLGSMMNPVPFGMGSDIDNWRITVVDVIPDATQIILDENMFNSEPEPGYQYFMVNLLVENIGSEPEEFNEFYLHLVGDHKVSYDHAWVDVPDPLPSTEIFPGGMAKGNVAWEVPSDEVDSLIMYYKSGDERKFWALK